MQSGLPVISKTDLAALAGADLSVMERGGRKLRGSASFAFAQVKNGVSSREIADEVLRRLTEAADGRQAQ